MTYIPQGNRVSSLNSTTALLTAAATFTGTGEDVTGYTTVTVSILGTLTTAVGTLYFETSSDNSTWASIPRGITDITQDVPHIFLIAEQYFRVRYLNGAVEQTGSFRIQTLYANARPMTLSNTVESPMTINHDVLLQRVVNNIDLDLARKLVTGQRAFFFFGFNNAVGTSWEDIHPAGGDINWLTTAGQIELKSSNAADVLAGPGLGVQQVEVHGLSATGADQSEVIDMTGVTATTATTLSYIRVNKMHSETCGTYGGSHQGDITCNLKTGGVLLATMTGQEGSVNGAVSYGSGEAGNGYWSVPLGKVMYITRLSVIPDVATNKDMDVALYEREDILDTTTPFAPRRVLWQESAINSAITKEFKSHLKIKALTDVFFRARTISSGTSLLEVSLDFYLVDHNSDGA